MPALSPKSEAASPRPLQDESTNKFDDPDADIILRSYDSQEFRVLKLYIIRSSTVLEGLIQAATSNRRSPPDVDISPDARTPLPVVQMSDSGTILSFLLTFIFPMSPALPPTVDETMELLSVAQKYEMSSVLAHIRGSIALQDPPFIHQENAFRVYALSQKHGLRREAAQAARITLKFTMTIENLKGKLDIMPGAYLHELWKYHHRVQINLSSSINGFRGSGACGTLSGLNCLLRTPWGIPQWLDDYIRSIPSAPSFFDLAAFLNALARHVFDSSCGSTRCSSCVCIPSQTIHAFWSALTHVVHQEMEKAESALSMLGSETCSQHQTNIPLAHVPLPECLDTTGADIIVQSSDYINFPVHKSILASSSQFFRDMFSHPQPSHAVVNGLPVVHLSEDAELIRALITVMYPIPSEIPASYNRVLALLAAAQKYDMLGIQSSIRAEVTQRKLLAPTGTAAFVYAIAGKNRLLPEAEAAACLTLDHPLTFEFLGSSLRLFEGWALRDLASFRKSCRDSIVLCLESFLDVHNGPSEIWINCSGSKAQGQPARNDPALPSWLHGLFTQEIDKLKLNFTNSLKPSSIRERYLEALRVHIGHSDGCASCLTTHALQGEKYCVELEQKLASARDKVQLTSV